MVYFIGVGGIGMSALARYFNHRGLKVAGYDLTSTSLTDRLISEGIEISFDDDVKSVPEYFRESGFGTGVLVVYTPAVPMRNKLLSFFKSEGCQVVKRSALLGALVNNGKGIAIAGTHGKTSVSVMTAHLLSQTSAGCNAFLGGVSKNYESNLIISDASELIVVEADEYDRSFLQLFPDIALITSIDPDHLDIYGTYDEMKQAYSAFARQVNAGGTIICRKGLDIEPDPDKRVSLLNYGLENGADFCGSNIRIGTDSLPVFDLASPDLQFNDLTLGVPGRFNVENAVAAIAIALVCGVGEREIRRGLESYKGVYRRFDIRINTPDCVFIDDYAHHPAEIRACISSVREWFPNRKLTAIFQPHLFSRTRDFAAEFAESLDKADDLILLDIYPAREEPIPGVSSALIFNRLTLESKILCDRDQLPGIIARVQTDVVVTLGAGNIDAMVEPLMEVLSNKSGNNMKEKL
jgi:UDP-N-acetylmuramate--alanine ligase